MTPQKPMTRLLLVHSPLVGPASWDLIAPVLAEPGREVTIPDLAAERGVRGPGRPGRRTRLAGRPAGQPPSGPAHRPRRGTGGHRRTSPCLPRRRPNVSPNAADPTAVAGVSRVTGILRAAECNKAPFMYEMKGALFGYGPGSAGFPASRLRVGQSPGLTVPVRLVSQPHRSRSTGRPASLFRFARLSRLPVRSAQLPGLAIRFARLPGLPGATRRPPVPGTRCKFRFPGLSRVPGKPRDGARFLR
jgi:hypothetical protein